MALTPFLQNMYADQIRAKIPEADILKDAAKQAATEEKNLDQLKRQYTDLSYALRVAPQTLSANERAWLDRYPESLKQVESRVNMWRGGGVNVQDLSGTGGTISGSSLVTDIKPITVQQGGKDVTMYTVGGKVYNDMPSAQAASQAAMAQSTTTAGGATPVGGAGVPGAAVAPQGFNLQAGMDILNKAGLDANTQRLFAEVLKGASLEKGLDLQNIIKGFEKVKNETIDPYFAEQSKVFIDQIKSTDAYTRAARAGELEGEQMQSEAAVKGAQEDLEARGLTFSGKGVEQLGQKSALGVQGAPSATWQMGTTPEGKVNQANRLMATSSQARFQRSLEGLSREAEKTLGSGGSAGMVAGVQQLGNISGEMPRAQQAQYGDTFRQSYQAEQDRLKQSQNINLFK